MHPALFFYWRTAGGAMVKNPLANSGDTREASLISRLGRSHGVGSGNLLQYSCLENFMDRGAWWVTTHRVAKRHDRAHMHTQLLYSVALVSAIKRSESLPCVCVCVCVCPLHAGSPCYSSSIPSRSSQSTQLSSLCYGVGIHQLPVPHMAGHICQS